MVISWKKSVGAAWLLVSLGAAIEHDAMSPNDINLMYQDHNYLEPDLQPSAMEKEDKMMRNILFLKYLNPYGFNDIMPANAVDGPVEWLPSDTALELFQDTMMKRTSNVNKPRPAKPAVNKWKIKKGRRGCPAEGCNHTNCLAMSNVRN